MSRLRLQLSDDKSDSLIRGLDSDLDGKVSLDEFSSFLATNMLDIPAWQTAALYEALVVCLERSIAVEDVCMAIARISTLPETSGQSRSSDTWAQTAAELGVELQKLSSLFETFTRWDSNGDGFLSLEELQGALKRDLPEFSSKFSEDEFLCLMRHIDSLGVANNRISVLEFFRAVGPVKIKRALQLALLGEVLKPVYFYRAMLKSYLTSYDPSSNIVTTSQFASSLKEMNRQLESSGDMSLSESQINSVCEIASGGSATVQYRDFLNSLRAVDRQHTLAKLEVGKLSFLQAVLI
ncbi:unnamed protein product [Polarella glacialis]|uniref:EF-hand domain-containing protein n=1 Tax=Polarella glacialis TaxID=89957 RepID=A0A813KF41_POLGL|nr:unnamed protein product [Polarella glacialis]